VVFSLYVLVQPQPSTSIHRIRQVGYVSHQDVGYNSMAIESLPQFLYLHSRI
jgi:hypothetical protein